MLYDLQMDIVIDHPNKKLTKKIVMILRKIKMIITHSWRA